MTAHPPIIQKISLSMLFIVASVGFAQVEGAVEELKRRIESGDPNAVFQTGQT